MRLRDTITEADHSLLIELIETNAVFEKLLTTKVVDLDRSNARKLVQVVSDLLALQSSTGLLVHSKHYLEGKKQLANNFLAGTNSRL